MSGTKEIAEQLFRRDEDDPFAPVKVRRWNKNAKSVDALPEGALPSRKKKRVGMGDVSPVSRVRAAQGVPEAVVKVASYGGGSSSAVGQLDYISRDGELELEMSDGTILEDKDDIRDLVDHWSDDFHHRKNGARNTIHLVVSAPAGSDPEAVLRAGRGFAEKTFEDNHPYALVRHDDGDHPHVHIVARMRGDDGELFNIAPGDFHELRERFAEQCRENGIEMNATPRQVRGASRPEPQALRHMREDGRVPEIDRRASELLEREVEPSRTVKDAVEARQVAFAEEAKAHRELADKLERQARAHDDDRKRGLLDGYAVSLRGLADHLEDGGSVSRPEQLRGTERVRGDEAEPGRDTDPAAVQGDVDPAVTLEEARTRVERGVELARKIMEKLPEGADREKAQAALKGMEEVSERLHGRGPDHADGGGDPEPDRGADVHDGPSGPELDTGSREEPPVPELEQEEPAKPKRWSEMTGSEQMAKIKERDELARENGRDDDRDRD